MLILFPNGNILGECMLTKKNTDDISQIVRSVRKEQGLTQDDLAGLSGTGRRFISDLEAGKSTVQLGKVLLVLAALGLTLSVIDKWQNK